MVKQLFATCAALLTLALWVFPAVKAQATDTRSACEQFANSRYHANNPGHFEKIMLFPQNLVEEKLESKMGSQFVSAVLSGNGVLKLKNTSPVDIQFTCLADDHQKTVFFHATPNRLTNPNPVKDCEAQAATAAESIPCLEKLLKKEEQQLIAVEKKAKGQAASIDQHWRNTKANQLLGLSSVQWKRFRDSECLRRLAFRSGSNHPDITEYECLISKTRERIQDLNFDQ